MSKAPVAVQSKTFVQAFRGLLKRRKKVRGQAGLPSWAGKPKGKVNRRAIYSDAF